MTSIDLKYMFEKLLSFSKKDLFYNQMILYAENKMLACHDVDIELINFSEEALQEARKGKENSEVWFILAEMLRKIAHKIHFKYENPAQDDRFLRIIQQGE